MDKFHFVRDGVTRLPPGFRFQPTDEELVFQYLKRKIFSCPLPASIIPEINICKYDPWDLPGNLEDERYFFSNKEAKYPNGNRINRATASGYWKATGLDKPIVSSSKNIELVGMKKTLVFYRGKTPYESRTDWIMHEYRLVAAGTTTQNNYSKQIEIWVICRVFFKSRDMKDGAVVGAQPRFVDNMMGDDINTLGSVISSASSTCSSSSGGMSEVCSNGSSSDNEESSSRNIF